MLVASRGVVGHRSVGVVWPSLLWGDGGRAGVKQGRGQGSSLPTGNTDLHPKTNGGLRSRGVGVLRVSLFIVFTGPLPSPPLPRRLFLLPPFSVSPSAPGVCVADKRRGGGGGVEQTRCCLSGPVCPCQARDRVKGPVCGAPSALPAFVSPSMATPPPSRNPFL